MATLVWNGTAMVDPATGQPPPASDSAVDPAQPDQQQDNASINPRAGMATGSMVDPTPAEVLQQQQDPPSPHSRSEAILKNIQDIQAQKQGVRFGQNMDVVKDKQIAELMQLYQHVSQQENQDQNFSRFDKQYAAQNDRANIAAQSRLGVAGIGAGSRENVANINSTSRFANTVQRGSDAFDRSKYTADTHAQTADDQQENAQQINDDRLASQDGIAANRDATSTANTGARVGATMAGQGASNDRARLSVVGKILDKDPNNANAAIEYARIQRRLQNPGAAPTVSGPPAGNVPTGGAPGPRAAVTPPAPQYKEGDIVTNGQQRLQLTGGKWTPVPTQ